jgi:hypothetical protein
MNKYGLCSFNGKYPAEFYFSGKHKLQVQEAPEPYMVLWENYNVNIVSRFIRMILLWIPIIILIAFNYFCAYVIRVLTIEKEVVFNCNL